MARLASRASQPERSCTSFNRNDTRLHNATLRVILVERRFLIHGPFAYVVEAETLRTLSFKAINGGTLNDMLHTGRSTCNSQLPLV
jgi:hypothetical protein